MKYVSPEYAAQLDSLAETLMLDRQRKLGQLSLFEQEQQALEEHTAQIIEFPSPRPEPDPIVA